MTLKMADGGFSIIKADKVWSTCRIFVAAGGRKFRRIWQPGYPHVWMECEGGIDAIPKEYADQLESMLLAKLSEDESSIEQLLNNGTSSPNTERHSLG